MDPTTWGVFSDNFLKSTELKIALPSMYKTDGWNRSFLLALGLLPYKYSIINSDICNCACTFQRCAEWHVLGFQVFISEGNMTTLGYEINCDVINFNLACCRLHAVPTKTTGGGEELSKYNTIPKLYCSMLYLDHWN